jgi:hypothetical protein
VSLGGFEAGIRVPHDRPSHAACNSSDVSSQHSPHHVNVPPEELGVALGDPAVRGERKQGGGENDVGRARLVSFQATG